MKKTAAIIFSLLAGAGLYAASGTASQPAGSESKGYAPQIQNSEIAFGPKKLKLEFTSQIVCTDPNGQTLFRLKSSFWAQDLKTKKIEWGWMDQHLDKEKSSMKRDGNKFVWNLVYTVNGKSFPGLEQTLEVLPDGKLRFTSHASLPKEFEGFKMIFGSTIMTLPQAAWNGKSMTVNGESCTLDINNASQQFNAGVKKEQEVILAPGNAEQEIRLKSTWGGAFNYFAFRVFKETKTFRITAFSRRNSTLCSFELDLRSPGK